MDSREAGAAARLDTAAFLSYFKDMPDRRQSGKVTRRLDEILLLAPLATLAGAEGFTDIARFGRKQLDLSRRFPPFARGVPSHDHLGDISASLDAQAFRGCFVAWVGALTKVSEEANEIVVIPAPLDMLAIEGAIVTVDADRGRIETRRVTVVHGVAWLRRRHRWPGLEGLPIVEATREIGAKTERETRFHVTSSNLSADKFGPIARDRWAIENSLDWVMDMTFHDDQCRIRTDNAPENFVTLEHVAANLARRKKGKDSVRLARKTAARDDDYLAKLVAP